MASIYDTHGSLQLSSADLERAPLYLSAQCAHVISRVAEHILRDHECRAIDEEASARGHLRDGRDDTASATERAESLRAALEAALDCADAIQAERAALARIIDLARVAAGALEAAERDANRVANDARAALVAAGVAQ